MNIVSVLLVLFLIYFFNSWYQKIKKINQKELKGPFPLPVVGNLHQLGSLPHNTLMGLHKKYGSIYRLYFGDIYTVVVSDPSLIREICIDNAESIGNNRPVTPIFKHVQSGLGLSTSNFKKWKKNREILNNAMKRSSTKKIYDLLSHQANELVKSMDNFANTGKPFEMRLYAHRYSLATMFKYLFDENIDYDQDISTSKIAEFSKPFENIIKDLSVGNLGDFIHILQPFYYWYLTVTEKNVKLIKDFLKEKYDHHLSSIDYENPRDFLDTLIKEYGSDIDSKDDIISVCFDLFLAGSDTVSITMEWFTLRMCNHQDIQEKAFNELKGVVGDRNFIKLSDRASTPYFNAVIKEVLRSSPVTPFGLPKYAIENSMIGDYFIPKDSQILINYKALSFNENYFENPNQFEPLRFLNKNSDAYLPFSMGDRGCAGTVIASDELYIALSNILLNFSIQSTDGKLIDDTELFALTLKPNPFKVCLKSR